MRGLKVPFVAMLLLVALAGGAHAAPAAVDTPEAAPASPLPDVAGTVSAAAATGADVAGGAAGAVADAARAIAHGLAAVGAALGTGLSTLAAAFVAAAAAAARGVTTGVVLAADAVVDVARAVATLASLAASVVMVAARAAGAGLVDTAVALAGALVTMAEWFAGLDSREQAAVAGAAGSPAAAWSLQRLLQRYGWLAGIPLYSRLNRADLLKNEVRARVFAHIRENPGAHPTAIAGALGLGWGTVVYHLDRLRGAGFVRAEKRGSVKSYFVVGEGLSLDAQKRVAALQNLTARRVATFIAANPAATQKDVARGLGASAALVSWHVKRLAASDVLRVEREGKATRLFLADGVPVDAVQAPSPAVAALTPAHV